MVATPKSTEEFCFLPSKCRFADALETQGMGLAPCQGILSPPPLAGAADTMNMELRGIRWAAQLYT